MPSRRWLERQVSQNRRCTGKSTKTMPKTPQHDGSQKKRHLGRVDGFLTLEASARGLEEARVGVGEARDAQGDEAED